MNRCSPDFLLLLFVMARDSVSEASGSLGWVLPSSAIQ